jgi:hypothetical protein
VFTNRLREHYYGHIRPRQTAARPGVRIFRVRTRPAVISFLVAFAAGLLLLALPGTAAAKPPCWKQVLNDWSNGRPIGVYPLHCYRDAIRNLPEDLRDYSNAADDIQAALQAQISKRTTRSLQSDGGSPTKAGKNGDSTGAPPRSAYRRAIDNLGTSNVDTLPTPLLVLASLGGFLLALAAAMTLTKRVRALRARRGPPS